MSADVELGLVRVRILDLNLIEVEVESGNET